MDEEHSLLLLLDAVDKSRIFGPWNAMQCEDIPIECRHLVLTDWILVLLNLLEDVLTQFLRRLYFVEKT